MSGVATAAAAAAVVGGAISGKMQSDAANKAAREQRKTAYSAMTQEEQQLDKMRELLSPYVSAGNTALQQQLELLGLAKKPAISGITGMVGWGGELTEKGRQLKDMTDAEYAAMKQQEAIQGIAQSPELQALTAQGEEAIMRNAAATGGLRSGNVQGALAQYRPAMLQQAIDRRYSQLAGLTGIGQASAAGVGAAGLQTGTNISNLYQQAGAANAGSALAQGQAQGQMWSGLGQAAGIGLGAYYNRPQPTTPYQPQPGAEVVGTYQGQPIRVW